MDHYSKPTSNVTYQSDQKTIFATGGIWDENFVNDRNACVGIELGATGIKLAALRNVNTGIELVNWGIYELPDNTYSSNIQSNTAALETLLDKLKIKRLRAALALNNGVFLQYVAMPVLSDANFIARVPSYVGPGYLGNGEKDIYYAKPYSITRDSGGAVLKEGLAIIVDEKYFSHTLESAKKHAINVIRVEPSSLAFVDLFSVPMNYLEPFCVIDLGASSVRITVVQNKKIIFHRTTYSIDKYLTRELSEIYQIRDDQAERIKKKMHFSEADAEDSGAVNRRLFEMTVPIFNILVDELNSTFRFFKKESGKNVNKLILTGGGANISGLDKFLHQSIGVDVEIGNIMTKIKLHESVDRAQFGQQANRLASAIGAARNELLNEGKCNINLIGGHMSKEKQEQKTWKVAAILLIFLLTGFFVGQNLRARGKVYSENILAGNRILNELQKKIDAQLDATARVAEHIPSSLRVSQILQQVGVETPSTLWLESMQLEREKVGSRSSLVKISTAPNSQKSDKEILYFDGRAVDREAIKNFLHQVEGTSQWETVTLTHIEWVGSNQNGIWEFTIRLIR